MAHALGVTDREAETLPSFQSTPNPPMELTATDEDRRDTTHDHTAEAGANYHAASRRVALAGNAPFRVAVGSARARAELAAVRRESHCLGIVQLPIAA